MKATRLLKSTRVLALVSLLSVAAVPPTSRLSQSQVDPSDFVSQIDNKFMPLEPGTTLYYEGETDGVPTSDVFEVTHDTRSLEGVTTTVVHDRGFENGVLIEDTLDYFAQDKDGNVWYFGEDTKQLDANGNVTGTEGSWLAGVDGAEPGIIMEAHPHPGDKYAQENAPDVAQDMAQVASLKKSACVPYGCFDDLLLTKETSPLEPGTVENKYYAEGVGEIRSVLVKGGDEYSNLVKITGGARESNGGRGNHDGFDRRH